MYLPVGSSIGSSLQFISLKLPAKPESHDNKKIYTCTNILESSKLTYIYSCLNADKGSREKGLQGLDSHRQF